MENATDIFKQLEEIMNEVIFVFMDMTTKNHQMHGLLVNALSFLKNIKNRKIVAEINITEKELPENEKLAELQEKLKLSSFDLFELLLLNEALKQKNYVQKDAADLLGISPRVINYKIKKWRSYLTLPQNFMCIEEKEGGEIK